MQFARIVWAALAPVLMVSVRFVWLRCDDVCSSRVPFYSVQRLPFVENRDMALVKAIPLLPPCPFEAMYAIAAVITPEVGGESENHKEADYDEKIHVSLLLEAHWLQYIRRKERRDAPTVRPLRQPASGSDAGAEQSPT